MMFILNCDMLCSFTSTSVFFSSMFMFSRHFLCLFIYPFFVLKFEFLLILEIMIWVNLNINYGIYINLIFLI